MPGMRRREFLTLIGGAAAAWPLAASAEQAGKVYRIGFLANDPTIPTTAAGAAFRDGLSKGGFVEGDNILIDWRFAEGRADRYAELASTLVRLRMDLIVASSGLSGRALSRVLRTLGPTSRVWLKTNRLNSQPSGCSCSRTPFHRLPSWRFS